MTIALDFGTDWQGIWIHFGDMNFGFSLGFMSFYITRGHLLQTAAAWQSLAFAAANSVQKKLLKEGMENNADINELCRSVEEASGKTNQDL